jgi:hypothetical protein
MVDNTPTSPAMAGTEDPLMVIHVDQEVRVYSVLGTDVVVVAAEAVMSYATVETTEPMLSVM